MMTTRRSTIVWTRDSAVLDFGARVAGSDQPPASSLEVEPGTPIELVYSLRNANAILLRHIGPAGDRDVEALYTTAPGETLPRTLVRTFDEPGTYRLHSGLVWQAENWCVPELAREVSISFGPRYDGRIAFFQAFADPDAGGRHTPASLAIARGHGARLTWRLEGVEGAVLHDPAVGDVDIPAEGELPIAPWEPTTEYTMMVPSRADAREVATVRVHTYDGRRTVVEPDLDSSMEQPEIGAFKIYRTPWPNPDAKPDELTAARATAEDHATRTVYASPGDLITLAFAIQGAFAEATLSSYGSVAGVIDLDGYGRVNLHVPRDHGSASLEYTLTVEPAAESHTRRTATVTATVVTAEEVGALGPPTSLVGCGEIAWWRVPDLVQMAERHGQVEHLIVQLDFMAQAARNPRAEWSIPESSKSNTGLPGYADVVALASREIWEIKPRHLEAKAQAEAARYVHFATMHCGAGWKPGSSYVPGNRVLLGPPIQHPSGRVPLLHAPGPPRIELFAEQGTAGAIRYWWEVDGKVVEARDRATNALVRQLYDHVVTAVFGNFVHGARLGPPKTAPDDLPPIRWAPLLYTDNDIIPELRPLLRGLNDDLHATGGAALYPEGTTSILLIDAALFDKIVGPRRLAQKIGWLRVEQDPVLKLQRDVYSAIHLGMAAGLAGGILISAGVAFGLFAAAGALLLRVASTLGAQAAAVLVPLARALVSTVPRVAPALGIATTGVMITPSRLAFAAPIIGPGPTITGVVPIPVRHFVLPVDQEGIHRIEQEVRDPTGATWRVAGIARAL